MVLHDIKILMESIPEIENIVTFYDDGTVFQTTFDKSSINIPKLGNDLASILTLFRNLEAKNSFNDYNKIIYDGLNVSLLIFKAGEQSNIALFFKRELSDREIQNLQIRKYIDRIQELIDIDRIQLIEKEIGKKINGIKLIDSKIATKRVQLNEIGSWDLDTNQKKKKLEEIEKEISQLEQEKRTLEEEIKKLDKNEIK